MQMGQHLISIVATIGSNSLIKKKGKKNYDNYT